MSASIRTITGKKFGGPDSSRREATIALAASKGWLRSVAFDSFYIFGVSGLALFAGLVVWVRPELFPYILLLDLWLLGYHHVISTFTRLAFDTESFKQHRFLVLVLPVIVLATVTGACVLMGTWVLATTYLYWQWFHYTRQSYGIARIYERKSGMVLTGGRRLTQAIIYLIPLCGILYRSYQRPTQFLGMELRTLPVPFWAVASVAASAVIAMLWWAGRQLRAFRQGEFQVAHTLYLLSHAVIFVVGYLVIEDLNHGWLVVNVWHNLQYILLVWMFNNNRFKSGISGKARFLSTISQRENVALYFLVCLGVTTFFYVSVYFTLTGAAALLAPAAALPLMAIAYQVINFHHYIVDALIWKVRKKSLKVNLGIAA